MKRAVAACAATLLVAVTGCGSGSDAAPPDPATLAPPDAVAFVRFEIAPAGAEADDFDAAFGKLLGPAPRAALGAIFTDETQTSGRLDYFNDIRPWLGREIALVVTGVTADGADFALLAASTDDDEARASIERDVAGIDAPTRRYRDVSYRLLDGRIANGVVSHHLVAGTESAFKAVVDAAEDDKSLSETEKWRKAVGDRGDGKIGLAYLDAKGFLPGVGPVVATLDAEPDRLVVDIVGVTLARAVDAVEADPLLASAYASVADALRARAGLDPDTLANDDHFERLPTRLRQVEYVAAGTLREGDRDVARVVIGLR